MFTLFYRNIRLLILTIILIFVWGISSYFTLPRLEDPELVSRVAVVKTFFPGASAERVESLVTEKIEDKLTEIEEIDTYESTSRAGSSLITIELSEGVQKEQVDGVWSRVRNQLDEVTTELPTGTTEPELEEAKVKAYALITALTWQQDDSPNYAILRRQAEVLKERIEAIAGTEEVEIFGDPDEEILVEIDPTTLANYDLTASELAQQIAQSDAKVAAGQLRSSDNDLLIEVAGELDTLQRVRQIPIRFSDRSQFIRLEDIATVSKGIVEPLNDLALVKGKSAVALGVHVESGIRSDRWAKAARQTIAQFNSQLPSSIGLPIIFDQSRYVEARLNGLIVNLLLGAGLVAGVTLLMMGWQSALIVSSALPLSVLMVFGWMNLMDIPLHQMSVTGLIVALGILIDNAIVVVDEVQNHLNRGIKAKAAITTAIHHLAVPLLSSTITTVLAFLPIALLPGSTGEFVGTIAISVILAVSSSLFIALTVTPVLTAKLHQQWKSRGAGETNGQRNIANRQLSWLKRGFSHPVLTRLYRWSLKRTTAQPVLGITLALLLPITGFMQAGSLAQQFFPAADRDQLQIELELPSSASIAQTQSLVQQIRQQIIEYPEVADVHWFIGESAPEFYYNLTGGREQEANYAQALVQLKSLAKSDLSQQLQTQLDAAFPTARILVRQLEQGPPFDAPIEMRIYGSDLDKLQELGEQARSLLVQNGEVTHTRASLSEVRPQLQFQVDEAEVRLAGLDRVSIAQQLDNALEGSVGGSILEATEELPVRVRLANTNRGNLAQITSLDLQANSAGRRSSNNSVTAIPLSALGKVELEAELAKITHYNGQKVNTVQGFLAAGVLPAEVLSRFKQQLANSDWQLPQGYSYEFGGEEEERNNAIGGLFSTVSVLMVLMVATLVLSLGSFRLAAIIGVVAVASFGLGLFSVWLFDYPFGFNPIIGTVGLIGVAINDSIVVLAAIKQHPVARTGNRQAIQEVVLHSTRHVLTTTFTTMVGFVPLLLGGGEFWPPLAVAIAGGVGGATLLALYLVPSAYLLLVRHNTKVVTISQSLLKSTSS